MDKAPCRLPSVSCRKNLCHSCFQGPKDSHLLALVVARCVCRIPSAVSAPFYTYFAATKCLFCLLCQLFFPFWCDNAHVPLCNLQECGFAFFFPVGSLPLCSGAKDSWHLPHTSHGWRMWLCSGHFLHTRSHKHSLSECCSSSCLFAHTKRLLSPLGPPSSRLTGGSQIHITQHALISRLKALLLSLSLLTQETAHRVSRSFPLFGSSIPLHTLCLMVRPGSLLGLCTQRSSYFPRRLFSPLSLDRLATFSSHYWHQHNKAQVTCRTRGGNFGPLLYTLQTVSATPKELYRDEEVPPDRHTPLLPSLELE